MRLSDEGLKIIATNFWEDFDKVAMARELLVAREVIELARGVCPADYYFLSLAVRDYDKEVTDDQA